MPPLTFNAPSIVHHMAALDNQAAPQNSLEAVQGSLQAGAAFIEVDVTALAEDDYLLVHDPDLASETSGKGRVAECSIEQARDLKIMQNGRETEFRAAQLRDVVKLFLQSGGETRLQLDFKNIFPFANDEPLHRLIQIVEPLGERVIVSSGADWQLRKLRKMAPWLRLGFDIMWYIGWQPAGEARDPGDFPKNLGAYGYYDDHMLASIRCMPTMDYLQDRCESLVSLVPDVSVFYLDHPLIAQSLRDGFNWAYALHAQGIKLDAWTMDVTNPDAVENAKPLLEAGVDLFTSNTPRAWAKLLGLAQDRPSK
jgi:glycerophosphoryl diester phosphodiesterase